MPSLRARILLVDDEPAILETCQEILRIEGYTVDAVASGSAALEAAMHTTYDLLVTDLKMEGMDGLELLAEFQKRSPQTVTVMMTGYGTIDSATEAVRLGAYEFLLKPVAVEDLHRRIDEPPAAAERALAGRVERARARALLPGGDDLHGSRHSEIQTLISTPSGQLISKH